MTAVDRTEVSDMAPSAALRVVLRKAFSTPEMIGAAQSTPSVNFQSWVSITARLAGHRHYGLSVVDHAGGRGLADQAGVVQHRGDVGAGVARPQPRQVGVQQLAEQVDLDVADHAVADAVGDRGLADLGDATDQTQPHDGQTQEDQLVAALLLEDQLDDGVQDPGQARR